MLVLMLNISSLFLLSVEIVYLVRKKRIRRNFTVDIEFYSYYFFKRASIRRVRIYMQKLTSINTEKVLIGHYENRLLLDDIFVDLTLQMNNGELIIDTKIYIFQPLQKFLLLVPLEEESLCCARNCCAIGVRHLLKILILRSCLNSVGSILKKLATCL